MTAGWSHKGPYVAGHLVTPQRGPHVCKLGRVARVVGTTLTVVPAPGSSWQIFDVDADDVMGHGDVALTDLDRQELERCLRGKEPSQQ